MDLLRFVLDNTNPLLAALAALTLGVLLVLSTSGAVRETDETTAFELFLIWARRALIILLFTGLPLFAAFLFVLALVASDNDLSFAHQYMDLWMQEVADAIADLWWSLVVVLLFPLTVRVFALRFLRPFISSWVRKFRVRQSGDAVSDVRVEMEKLKAKDFDPHRYYKNEAMFLGLDECGKPVYMDDVTFRKNHLKIIGPSQTGKGVGLGVLLDQAIAKGWGVWFIDLKPDDFIYDIMRESCERNKRSPPTLLDFNGIGPGSYAPFVSGTARERRERVVKAYSLADSGQQADFYKRNEREVLDFLMPLWDGTLPHLSALLRGKHPAINDHQRQWILSNSGSLRSNTSEFSQLEALCAERSNSLDVKSELDAGRVVYVRSHLKDTVVRKGTVALLDELIQIALRAPIQQPIFIGIDECRFVVSDTLADALATVLSKNINLGLCYQSVNDLLNLPDKSLNAQSIKTGIETNTQITISYRANDFDTAEWVSGLTGTTAKTVTKLEKVEINQGGAEEWAGERSVGQVEEQLITPNQLLSLPPRIGAIIRPNVLSSLLYTCWVPVTEFKGMPARPETTHRAEPLDSREAAQPQPLAKKIKKTDSTDKIKPVKLSADEEAAISVALAGILDSNAFNSGKLRTDKGSQDDSPALDLSQLDDIEGL
ncbi:MAG TPA: hypothetical protein ENI17_02870 [Pseudomonas xinjiangensis]|uniref:TraD/TraG TraM recognition site domain-containing protein n=2 Tax=root TaxID=1 RepID=A0A7V1BRQ8_9GAMM|nr:hypothetical protein [Halopseudomonas xinjiangensis]HEC46551.1 hypothetical protein [Halopseudomonas xinjiangensis]